MPSDKNLHVSSANCSELYTLSWLLTQVVSHSTYVPTTVDKLLEVYVYWQLCRLKVLVLNIDYTCASSTTP